MRHSVVVAYQAVTVLVPYAPVAMAHCAGPSPTNSGAVAMDDEDSSEADSLPEEGPVIWQAEYASDGQSYWWDLPAEVCTSLERVRSNPSEDLIWVWCRNPQDEPELHELCRYLLDPHAGIQRNLDTDYRRPLRRVVVLRTDHPGPSPDASPSDPGPTADVISISDTDMAPVTALDAATSTTNDGYFVLPTWRSARPRNDIYTRCPVCRGTYQGRDLRDHEEQHHTFQDFHCATCAKEFQNSAALREHSRLSAHEISTDYVYRYNTI